jgi:hypothetical protein
LISFSINVLKIEPLLDLLGEGGWEVERKITKMTEILS